MLVEASLNTLIASTERIETKFRHHIFDQVRLPSGYTLQRMADGSLIAQATTDKGFVPKIKFKTEISEEQQPNMTVVQTVDGETLYVEPAKMADDVLITCSCDDFVYRFAITNKKQGVLFGDIRKTPVPKGVRPSANLNVIGVCKHLLKLTDLLKTERVFSQSS